LIILLIVDNKQSSFEWSAFDKNGAKIASGTSSAR
jgi:hypothetical protein